MADESWESALKLVQDGNIREAHSIFEKIVSSDVHNISAWFWYAKTGASSAERTRILQNCLRLNPDSAETREVLDLAPIPQPEPPSAASHKTGNSLAFTAPGSLAPENDSGESTKPLKAYVPTAAPASAVPAAARSRVPLWIVLLLAAMLIVFLAVAAWAAFKTIPRAAVEPAAYGYVEMTAYLPCQSSAAV